MLGSEIQVTIEQWRTLLAVVDCGGYANAAEKLNKSQSTLSYAIQKLETNLNLSIFKIEGRRAVLTSAGRLLYKRAQDLVYSAAALEDTAKQLSGQWQSNLSIAVDTMFPSHVLYDSLEIFGKSQPYTRVNIIETTLSGSNDALIKKDASLAITGFLGAGFVGHPLINIKFVAAAAPHHPLFEDNKPVHINDLKKHRQLVIRDSGNLNMDSGWLSAEQRWSFSHVSTSIEAAISGLGFAWYPETRIAAHLKSGKLKPLPLSSGLYRYGMLYLVYADNEMATLCCQNMGQILIEQSNRYAHIM